jgi:hypothetical protein
MSDTITYSRSQSFKACRKRHWYEYELGLRTITDARALRIGTAHHAGVDCWKKTGDAEAAIESARAAFPPCPESFDAAEWKIDRETVAALCSGYCWRWRGSPHKIIASEIPFRLPLVNRATGAKSTRFELAGKIDGIIELEDGRLAVEEEKTASEDIAIGSDYFRRLQIDTQPSIYVYAARQLGFDVATVLWSCTRKPTIKPTAVAVTDDLGAKIVLDSHGNRAKTARGEWRQTGSAADGYVLQTRPMTADEWTQRLVTDIGERPDYYYARVEIPRLDSELEEMQDELWDFQKTLREAQLSNRWFRTVSADTCTYCSYFGLCVSKWRPEAGAPEGFQFVDNCFPELATESTGLVTATAVAGEAL